MTGLDLETFLQLLRADLGAWVSLGLVAAVLAVMALTSWGSRKALRKCLVLSIVAHIGLILYGSTFPVVMAVLGDRPEAADEAPPVHVQLADDSDASGSEVAGANGSNGRPGRNVAAWDRANDKATLVDPSIRPIEKRNEGSRSPDPQPPDLTKLAAETAAPEVNPPIPTPVVNVSGPEIPVAATTPAPTDSAEIGATVARRSESAPVDGFNTSNRARSPISTPSPTLPGPLDRTPGTAPSLAAAPVLVMPSMPAPPLGNAPGERLNPTTSEVAQADPAEIKTPARPMVAPATNATDNVVSFGGSERRKPAPNPTRTGNSSTPLPSETPKAVARGLATPSTIPSPSRAVPALSNAPRMGNSPGPAPVMDAAPAELEPPKSIGRGPLIEGPKDTLAESNNRRITRPTRETPLLALNDRQPDLTTPRVTPSGIPGLPAIAGATGLTRPAGDVPQVYRSRLDPNRFALAVRAGATRESEQAVERALEWLRKHQDADGRWDGGTAKLRDGASLRGDDDFTSHCPAGDICFGECFYWEADTALTGLALLAYLGSGYTHTDGQYSETVARGLEYLRHAQKPDGDLRGDSKAVGMYCHAMATLALCEAYALTGDPKLKQPVERAVAFLVKSRAVDGQAWRYAPGAPAGDTSILGWVVMVLKSAQENGLPISANTKQGVLKWLGRVSAGKSGGLAFYQPGELPTVSMTAEAWVCRQFLGVGGPSVASTEAANFLLRNGPDRSEYNLYTWYYCTLAMYQHGGDAWVRWNAQVRDQLIHKQRLNGHAAGSWDPDNSKYGSLGGRIYSTALATLSLEVYYRYLRLYESPATISTVPATPGRPASSALPEIISEPMPNPR